MNIKRGSAAEVSLGPVCALVIILLMMIPFLGYPGSEPVSAGPAGGMIINHTCTDINAIPESAIVQAKSRLHIAYGHTSHGSQVTYGMTGLVGFMNGLGHTTDLYAWNNGGTAGALDLHDEAMAGDLGNPDRVTWAQRTRDYLGPADAGGHGSLNPDVNVIMWSWCGQVDGSESDINTYLNLMNGLETEYPAVNFVYMTGHLTGTGADGNVNIRNQQIRDYCTANNKILYDFADIESYDPDGAVNYMQLMANDNCDYDSDGNGSLDRNWATDWQGSHVLDVDWYNCSCAHSQPLNGNRKAYAAWWMFAQIAGWNEPAAYSINVTQDAHGYITPAGTGGVVTVNHGADQIFNVTPDEGYRVKDVLVDGISQGAVGSYTFSNVTSDHSIGASFEIDEGAQSTWYLAEGSTAWGFNTYISIENPNTGAVNVEVTYNTSEGPVAGGKISLPAMSQTTVNPSETVPNKDFSTLVSALNGEAIAVDRTMEWTGTGATSPEAHNSIGVNAPSGTWYLPEGSSAWGFETWLLIQNPNSSAAVCNVTYMIEGGEPVTIEKTVPAGTRRSYLMADDIGVHDASIKVESEMPVIPERAMYRNGRREGHDSIGTTTPAQDYYLAEGAVEYDSGYTTYVLIQNPQSEANRVTVTYLTGSGETTGPTMNIPPNSRKTIRVNDQFTLNSDVSTTIHGDRPIIAERAMYWNSPAGEACHDSIGMSAPHSTFYLPDGQSSDGRETWTLVANPNGSAVDVKIYYLTPTGAGNKTFTETINANSRQSFSMSDHGINGRSAVLVESLNSGKKIMVERAMYWNSRGAGTDTIGGYSD